ncbi:hypothetical protein [Actinomadura sp. WMMB 499]|uniref:hypothetical protein n=1 Tax=Actinomadura sp. WMMB 499 TaxID=1219491 RepID=UPI001243CCAF|nr:hypothetical protein [Actinomadura sp. WMMB 499]QFG24677.1 hypothetical protein F7P10_29560 [Actinomadura sp. WMMB 499]
MTVMTAPAQPDPSEEPERPTSCFAIGPIGNRLAPRGTPELALYEDALEVYETVTLPACARHGIKPVRADELPGSGEITEQICRHVREADIVIADLGGGNANVMYELGLRHAIGKPTIQIGDHAQLPFDVANIRTIRFDRTRSGLIRARKELEAALEAGLRNGFETLTSARVMRSEEALAGRVVKADDETAPGFVDTMAALEPELELVLRDFEEVGEAAEELGRALEETTPDLERLGQGNAQPSAWVLGLGKVAKVISEPAEELNGTTIRLSDRMKKIDEGVRHLLECISAMPKQSRGEEVNDFLRQLVEMETFPEETVRDLNELGQLMDWIKAMSRQLRKPVGKVSMSIGRLNRAAACVNEWAERARTMLERDT